MQTQIPTLSNPADHEALLSEQDKLQLELEVGDDTELEEEVPVSPYAWAFDYPDGTREVLYDPTPKALEYHQATAPNVLFWGGRGSGKSTTGRWDCHMRAMSYPGFQYLILRRTYPELEKSHLIHIKAEMKKLGGTFNETKKIAYYPNGSQGRFSHCATEADVLNLLSTEFHLMFFDELSTFEWDMFTRLAASVRVKKGSGLTAMVRGATNPLGPSAEEIMHYFVDKDVDPADDPNYDPADWYSIKANAEDNPHLDVVQYKKRFSGLASHVRKAWEDGEFILEHALFEVKPKVSFLDEEGNKRTIPYHYIDTLDLDSIVQNATIYRAYDHGYFPDPAVCLWIAHLGNRYIVFHEETYYKTIVPDIANHIREVDQKLGVRNVAITYADPTIDINTGADIRTIKDIFEMCGVPIERSINDRALYASSIHTALADEAAPMVPRLQIYTRGCPQLCKTLPKQRYDEKHPLKMADTKTDHWAIALAYFLISSGSMERRAVSQASVLRPWMREKVGDRFILGSDAISERRRR